MKLKDTFIAQDIDHTQYLVSFGPGPYQGFARSNDTAALIINCLRRDTDFDSIVDAVYAEYDADRATIAADVRAILDDLRGIGALEE